MGIRQDLRRKGDTSVIVTRWKGDNGFSVTRGTMYDSTSPADVGDANNFDTGELTVAVLRGEIGSHTAKPPSWVDDAHWSRF